MRIKTSIKLFSIPLVISLLSFSLLSSNDAAWAESVPELMNAGNAAFNAGDMSKAIEFYDKALAEDTQCVDCLLNRGRARLRVNNPAGCFEDLNKAVFLDASRDDLLLARAQAYFPGVGQPEAALKDYSTILGRSPTDKNALVNRAQVYAQLKNNGMALNDINKAIELDPNNGQLYAIRANIHRANGDQIVGTQDYHKAQELDPSIK